MRQDGGGGIAFPKNRPMRAFAVAAFVAAPLLAGCGQQYGDLGRAPKSALTETYALAAGNQLAAWRGAPVSTFALTEDETELRSRSYRFIMPGYRAGIFERGEAEAVRARIWPDHRRSVDLANYSDALREKYPRPAEPRYHRIAEDAIADTALIEPFFGVAHRVFLADESRIHAFQQAHFVPTREPQDVEGRLFENRRVMHWAVTALDWRLKSYAYALERARIEVPSPLESEAAEAIAQLESQVRLLERSLRDMRRGSGAMIYGGPIVDRGVLPIK